MDALGTHLLRCSDGGERIAAHDAVRDAIYYITREAGRVVMRERTGFLPSSILGGRGGCVDLVMSELVRGHTLLKDVTRDPTRVDLVARATLCRVIFHRAMFSRVIKNYNELCCSMYSHVRIPRESLVMDVIT